MRRKNIKKSLDYKIEKWLETIDNEFVKDTIRENLIITGGCFASMIQNEKVKDYDCYFRTYESLAIVANYYADKYNQNASEEFEPFYLDYQSLKGIEIPMIDNEDENFLYHLKKFNEKLDIINKPENNKYSKKVSIKADGYDLSRMRMWIQSSGIIGEVDDDGHNEPTIKVTDETPEYHPIFISSNAITLSEGIQIVVRFYGEPSDIHDTYDFVHTKAYYDLKSNEVVIPTEVYEAVADKELIYTGSKYPLCSFFRTKKFMKRDWRINAGEMLKISVQISDLDLYDINVLRDQLIGVDSAYFAEVVKDLEEQKKKDVDFEITQNYLIELIDRIF